MQIGESWYIKPQGIAESASAGGVIVTVRRGRVYVALVRQGKMSGCILPKGKVEPGEDLESAARREILEEAGFKNLELVQYLGERQRLNARRNRWVIAHYFLFQAHGRRGQPTDQEHGYACEWHPLDRLPEMFWPEQRALLEDLRPTILTKLAKTG